MHRAPVSAKGVGSMRARSAIRDALDHADGWLCYFSAAAATPLSLTYARDCVRPGTGGSASPPFSGFALVRRCTVSRLHGQSCIGRFRNGSAGLPQCLHQETSAQCQHQKTQRERDVSAQCAHTRTFRHRCVMHVSDESLAGRRQDASGSLLLDSRFLAERQTRCAQDSSGGSMPSLRISV